MMSKLEALEKRVERIEQELKDVKLWVLVHEANLDYLQWRDWNDDEILHEIALLIADIRLYLPDKKPMQAIAESVIRARNAYKNWYGMGSDQYQSNLRAHITRIRQAMDSGRFVVHRDNGIIYPPMPTSSSRQTTPRRRISGQTSISIAASD